MALIKAWLVFLGVMCEKQRRLRVITLSRRVLLELFKCVAGFVGTNRNRQNRSAADVFEDQRFILWQFLIDDRARARFGCKVAMPEQACFWVNFVSRSKP